MAVPGKKESKHTSSLMQSMASDDDLRVYCQPCDEEGARLPARGYCTDCQEHLCRDCFKFHKKNKLSKHHTLLDETSMPMSLKQSSTDNQTCKPDHLTTPCLKHPKEIIKFYCHIHEEPLCNVCVILKHQSTPCKVNYIPDISGDIIDSKDYQETLKTVHYLSDIYTEITRDVKEMTDKSNISLKEVLADITKFRQEINKRLDELERQTKAAAKVIEQDNDNNLKKVEATCETTIKSLQTLSDTIKLLNTSKQADKLFLELKLAEKSMQDLNKKILQLTSYDVKEHNFNPNEAILNKLKEEKSFGTLNEKAVKIKSRQTSHVGEICVQTSSDKWSCWITGMTILTPDLLIITDFDNKAIKLVDTSSQSVTDQLQLPDGPWDIAAVTNTELAVTLREIETIQFISVSLNKLTKKRSMKVGGVCYGISCVQGKLVVSFCEPAKLQILDISGTVLTEIDGKNILKHPCYVKTNSSSIYVSGWEMKTVIRLNWQGEVTGSYGSIKSPHGIAMSDNGTIFVCDRDSDVIEEIAGDCSTGKVVLKDVKCPQALFWCTKTSKLYFSRNEGHKNDNLLQIYDLSNT